VFFLLKIKQGGIYMTTKRINRIAPQSGRVLVSGEQIGDDLSFVFANSAAANMKITATVLVPVEGRTRNDPVQSYLIGVVNPSTESDLTVKLFNVRNNVRYYLTSLTVPKSATIKGSVVSAYDFLVQGLFIGDALSVDVSNDTAIGATGAYSAVVTILEA
jgi:hypothetical protein